MSAGQGAFGQASVLGTRPDEKAVQIFRRNPIQSRIGELDRSNQAGHVVWNDTPEDPPIQDSGAGSELPVPFALSACYPGPPPPFRLEL